MVKNWLNRKAGEAREEFKKKLGALRVLCGKNKMRSSKRWKLLKK
jgi:hypothetical protein